jgi:hypothetical protein
MLELWAGVANNAYRRIAIAYAPDTTAAETLMWSAGFRHLTNAELRQQLCLVLWQM